MKSFDGMRVIIDKGYALHLLLHGEEQQNAKCRPMDTGSTRYTWQCPQNAAEAVIFWFLGIYKHWPQGFEQEMQQQCNLIGDWAAFYIPDPGRSC